MRQAFCNLSFRTLGLAPLMTALGVSLLGGAAPANPLADSPSFAHEVRPILSDKCFLCHGPDAETREADLRLDTEDGVAEAFLGGDLESSEAWRRMLSEEPDEIMPPPEAGKPLSEEEIATLRRWIEGGAKWTRHWAFEPPQRVAPPGPTGKQPIDAFMEEKLASAGIEPAPLVTREQLLRRVAFDLTGLPPTLGDLDAFLADAEPGAYERAIDGLLASPHLGERFASVWLDAARYSDTLGYQRDFERRVWPWRDWVVEALNDNLPYDEFVRQQLAGDLIENPTRETILATTFNRLHGQKVEGGSIPEEFRMEYVADRTQTVASSMLGLTMECCRCHDHKFDPLSIKDYYAFSGFFDKIDETGIIAFFTPTTPPPTLKLPTPAEESQLSQRRTEVTEAEARLAAVVVLARERFATREGQGGEVELPEPIGSADFEAEIKSPNESTEGVRGKAIRLTGDDEYKAVEEGAAFQRNEPFSIALWVRADREHDRAVIFHASKAAVDSASRGYELLLEGGRLSTALVHFWPGDALRIQSTAKFALDRWTHVAVTYDGSSRAAGLRLFVDGCEAETEVIRDTLSKTTVDPSINHLALGARFRDRGFKGGEIDDVYAYDTRLSVRQVASLAGAEVGGSEVEFEHFLFTQEDYRQAISKLTDRRAELVSIENKINDIMVMERFEGAPPTRVRLRGAYDQLGEEVQAAPPAVLPPLPEGRRADRLALADWMIQPDHPLTSRVAVNRIWQSVMGEGLVRTPEDFGAQGQSPTHPELLDYLAVEFIQSGWDVKALLRRIVLSETYRRSTIAPAEAVAADPENLLLGRATRRRWSAEMLRDNALAASGLLARRLGGEPVKPYEVEAAFVPMPRDKGKKLYRRSLYTYFKRSAPAPLLTAFDAPDRSVCRVKRERTKSPMQALVLLNGIQFVEAARVLAESSVEKYGDDETAVVRSVFRSLTSLEPSEQEAAVLIDLLRRQRERFAAEPERAEALLAVGDRHAAEGLDQATVAATTVVAQTIMSCDKSVTRL